MFYHLAIVATNTCPKLSSDQSPGSNVTVDATVASTKSEKFVASVVQAVHVHVMSVRCSIYVCNNAL